MLVALEINDIAVVYFSPSITRLLKVINDKKEMLVPGDSSGLYDLRTCSRGRRTNPLGRS